MKHNRFLHRGLYILIIGLIVSFTLAGCKDNQAANGWPVNTTGVNGLPAWNAGQFGSVKLTATRAKEPLTWKVKEGSALPEGFKLAADGTFSGTPPLLPAGTSQRITPPFTVIMTDANGKATEIQLSVTILQAIETTTPTVFTTPTTRAATTTKTTLPGTASATIGNVQVQYIGVEWSNGLGDFTYRYRVTASGTATGPVDSAITVTVGMKAANVGLYNDVRSMVNGPWSTTDKPYNCVRRTASDSANISWTFTQDIIVNYGPTAGPEWPGAADVYIQAKMLTGNGMMGSGYGVAATYQQPFTIPLP